MRSGGKVIRKCIAIVCSFFIVYTHTWVDTIIKQLTGDDDDHHHHRETIITIPAKWTKRIKRKQAHTHTSWLLLYNPCSKNFHSFFLSASHFLLIYSLNRFAHLSLTILLKGRESTPLRVWFTFSSLSSLLNDETSLFSGNIDKLPFSLPYYSSSFYFFARYIPILLHVVNCMS